MKRLTHYNEAGGIDVVDVDKAIVKLAAYEDLGLDAEDIDAVLESLGYIYAAGKLVIGRWSADRRETEGDSGYDE